VLVFAAEKFSENCSHAMHKRQLLNFTMLAYPMLYRDRLHPWCIIRLLPNARTIIVARFRRRNNAEAHMKVLRRMKPDAIYQIMFDTQQENEE
jgi:hypothetical protein